MIEWISDWAGTIIITVIIATIIEMILPEGSSKKYIKVVIGIYILFTVISPVISKFTGKTLEVSDIIDLDKYVNQMEEKGNMQNSLEANNYESIREIYMENLKSDIKSKLKGKGYTVTYIELDIENDDNYTLNKINLSVIKNEDKTDNENMEQEMENSNIENVNLINIGNLNDIEIGQSNTVDSNSSDNTKTNSTLLEKDKKEIKEYLGNVYDINKKNIIIN